MTDNSQKKESLLGEALKSLYKSVTNNFFEEIKARVDQIVDRKVAHVSIAFQRVTDRLLMKTMYYFTGLLSFIFIGIGFMFLLIDFVDLPRGVAFTLIGIVLVLISLGIKYGGDI